MTLTSHFHSRALAVRVDCPMQAGRSWFILARSSFSTMKSSSINEYELDEDPEPSRRPTIHPPPHEPRLTRASSPHSLRLFVSDIESYAAFVSGRLWAQRCRSRALDVLGRHHGSVSREEWGKEIGEVPKFRDCQNRPLSSRTTHATPYPSEAAIPIRNPTRTLLYPT
ncbi:hypothetical protein FA13DRAFT_1801593 [Coprinellus micaceus]|uniref:Uncharacterized protein n=1 Tax=Coprinellus micaceus TaxID=71717 RepID=A0A4Y7SEC8_COPMI|nr:hypothetical protein FA13DRAFT_1801593 [Coprinellus micaceus]